MAVATDRGSDAVGKYSAKNSKMYLIRDAVFDRVGKWVATPLLKVMPSRNVFRTLLALAIVGLFVFSSPLDVLVSDLWAYLRETWWFRHDTFEPMLATLSFFPWLSMFYILDLHTPIAAKYRIRKSKDMSHWKYNGDGSFRGWPVLVAYILPLMVFDYFFPRRNLPLSPPSSLRLVGEIVGLLIIYDALFFLCHRGMHLSKRAYQFMHQRHHEKSVTRAFDAVRLTFSEEFVDVTCSIVGVNLLKAHPLSRAIYNSIIIYLLVELHCGYDFPWMVHNLVPFGLMGGPPRHDEHHKDGRNYFQKFFTYLDNYFGPLNASTYKPLSPKRSNHI
eukprot:m.55254 g.55254  ORF g.55254 m.55254 type:complete len:331 (-) comp7745_c0_seq4:197-1189(-)